MKKRKQYIRKQNGNKFNLLNARKERKKERKKKKEERKKERKKEMILERARK